MSKAKYTFQNLDTFMTSDLLAHLDPKQSQKLFSCLMDDRTSPEDIIDQITKTLETIDWRKNQRDIAHLVSNLLPFEKLVPTIYKNWRPIVKEAMIYVAGRLPHERLIPKLVDQVTKPDQPLEERLISFITEMPTLQKLGQIIARNRNLDPKFRIQLIQLENSIRDVRPKDINAFVKKELGSKLRLYQVTIEDVIHSEASISAVTRFSWLNPETQDEEQGVFKVQKPKIEANFRSEMKILSGLAQHLNNKCSKHVLSQVDLVELMEDVREHLERELDAEHEQKNLVDAYERHQNTSGIRIPKLIKELSTSTLTAMSFEEGKKVTEAFQDIPWRKNELGTRLVEALVATPLYSSEEEALFHADPHAGNLYVNEKTRDLIILDWSLTERLTRDERKNLVMLISALLLRDEQLIFHVINELSTNKDSDDGKRAEELFKRIHTYVLDLPAINLPTIKQVLQLLDDIAMTGTQFSTGLVIFRKVLLTLDGVLKDVGGQMPLESVIAHYAFKEWMRAAWGMKGLDFMKKPVTLSPMDTLSLIQSAQWFGLRTGLQTMSNLLGKS